MMRKDVVDEKKQYQVQQAQEAQLQSLLRQYLICENASRRSQFSRSRSFEKVVAVKRLFRKEHHEVLKDLYRATDPGKIRADEKVLDELSTQMSQYSWYQDQVETYKTYIAEVEDEIKLKVKIVDKLQKQQIPDCQYSDYVMNMRQTVEALENKLETQMKQFGTICSKNKELREKIEHLMMHRQIFMRQWLKLIERLSEGKKILMDLIEQATVTYTLREEWCSKLTRMRVHGLNSLNTHLLEVRRHKAQLDNNVKLQDFLWVKGQKRIMEDLHKKHTLKRQMNEERLRETLTQYKKLYRDIEKFTGESSSKYIALNFAKEEEVNMSSFTHVLEMIRESEEIGDDLAKFHLEIDAKNALHASRQEQQRQRLEELECELEDQTAETSEARELYEETESYFKELLAGIQDLFNVCKCDKDPLIELLGDNSHVNRHNVSLYLGILESRVEELLVTTSYNDSLKDRRSRLLSSRREIGTLCRVEDMIKATPCSLCVEREMVSDVIDVLQHVHTVRESKSKLTRRLRLPGANARIHTVSHCTLPKARRLIQRRYE